VRCRIAGRGTVVAAALVLTGCPQIGPRALEFNRNQYNIAVQRTAAQELLLNLVRLRYRDTPVFLQVASVSASLRLERSVGIGGEVGSSDLVTLDGVLTFEETPTRTYTPLQGEQFVKQLLEPVNLEILLLLTTSGWSVERALLLLVQSINGIANAPTASGPTPEHAPRFERFLRVAHLLRALQQDGLLSLSSTPEDLLGGAKTVRRRVFLYLHPDALGRPETREMVEMLGLAPGRQSYEIVARIGQRDPERISVVPRSVTAAMFYASQSVEVPPRHEADGRVTVTRTTSGERFDWSRLTGSLIRIRSGEEPHNAYVAVRYRGSWFYIDDSDLQSKTTFSLLDMVLALQAGEVRSAGPVLTLPVSR
jgi:hypothetical protein